MLDMQLMEIAGEVEFTLFAPGLEFKHSSVLGRYHLGGWVCFITQEPVVRT